MAVHEQLVDLLEPVVEGLGYELVGIDYKPNPKHGLLRIYIDQECGITVDDCARVSHQISGVLDVEDPVSGHYLLEVSSPGLDRPLFKASDYQKFAGSQVKISFVGTWQGKRKLVGVIAGVDDEGKTVKINDPDGIIEIPFDQIGKANLIAEI
jgi:ribosome maturation factor RimP